MIFNDFKLGSWADVLDQDGRPIRIHAQRGETMLISEEARARVAGTRQSTFHGSPRLIPLIQSRSVLLVTLVRKGYANRFKTDEELGR
ncbi:MAG: hypothetical protein AB7N80_00175 [Bdellovibrionales bacterium]